MINVRGRQKRGGYLFVKITGSASLISRRLPQAGKHFKLEPSRWAVEETRTEAARRRQPGKKADEQADRRAANAEATRRSFEAAMAGRQPLCQNAGAGMK